MLQFDLNQIPLQILASVFDLGDKKTHKTKKNPTQEPIIITVIMVLFLISVQKSMDLGEDGCFHQLSKTAHMVQVKHAAKSFEEQGFLQADKSLIP